MKNISVLIFIFFVLATIAVIAQPVQESSYDPGAARSDLSNVEPSAIVTVIKQATESNFLTMDGDATFTYTLDVATLTVGGVNVLGDISSALDAIIGE